MLFKKNYEGNWWFETNERAFRRGMKTERI